MSNSYLTLGFDATTQEGVHINTVHLTYKNNCQVIALDQLPVGTAVHHESHICVIQSENLYLPEAVAETIIKPNIGQNYRLLHLNNESEIVRLLSEFTSQSILFAPDGIKLSVESFRSDILFKYNDCTSSGECEILLDLLSRGFYKNIFWIMAKKHQQKLLRVCRICGNLTGKDSIKTSSRRERIFNIFKINIAEDCLDVHPTQMCLKCNATIVNIENRGSKLLKPIPKVSNKCVNDCQHSFCSLCIILLIKGKLEKEAKCPICSSFIMVNSLCSSVYVLEMIKHSYIACKLCKKKVLFKDTYEVHDCQKDHLKSKHSTIIDDFYKVNKSSDVPQNTEAAVVHVIKQKLEHSKTTTIEFLSGGPRPLCLTVTPKAYKESASCSISTLKKRHRLLMEEVNHQVGNSKDSQVMQAAVMLKSFDYCQKRKILQNANIGIVQLSAEELVAFKADVGIPWNKLKTMTRWLNSRNVQTASNSKQRVVAKTWARDDLIVLDENFTFQNENIKCSLEIKHAPWAYIDNLPKNIENMLNILERYKL
ncbi:uncharacterized protein LOC124816065 [Hydra vulgaris]|uniref:uncharacterized protein LOC124816065 n=1 Tax=Hydra vulgaris TaxID=6087 RepID=UPI0032EA27BF